MRNTTEKSKPLGYLSQEQITQFVRDGYTVVRGLIEPDYVLAGLAELERHAGVVPADSSTWPKDKAGLHLGQEAIPFDRSVCVSPQMESVVEELAGVQVTCRSGLGPILRFPQPGKRQFEPGGAHIDGTRQGNGITMYPTHFHLLVMAYLTDTEAYDGAFTVWPGSPRQVFEYAYTEKVDLGEKWRTTGSLSAPELDYADPVAVTGRAGDVTFCHYLMVHSGSANRGDHVRVGLHGWFKAESDYAYVPKAGPPREDWTPVDHILRTDNLKRPEVG